MAKGLDLRRRIKSIKGIRSVTKAMEMVSASKMRKAQDQVLKVKSYSEKALEILASISEKVPNYPHYLLKKSDGKKYLVLLITSNKGLCGSLNSNAIRKTIEFIGGKDGEYTFVTLGKKGRDALFRLGHKVEADFSDVADNPSLLDISPVTKYLLEAYKKGNYDRVYIVYTHFLSILKQKPVVKRVVPLGKDITNFLKDVYTNKKDAEAGAEVDYEYVFEPTPSEVLDDILPRFVEMQIYQSVLEGSASEHSSRMVAMKNATEAAGELIDLLTLTYNKLRQSSITQEIAEIVGGVEALKN
ncbi:MAG: hypothetical protein ACD_51C00010G0002 [uncultured bacterium]|nr:MAG: hypothetical protein ACD_51C00010G0002 [uncultured bacterium]KKT02619.1 MAG: ATP synthase F1 subunit gamma, F-type H+-transporting ATPase subunit gamma [Candidatus Peregrinibacteria bacterium GW2011_GWF2_43_17]KKT18842.1 MAG: ATP synthase F1, gamma subunit [Candidatus Peregrinibacteria bacterium GW2011_GWA2_43_8]HAU39869.1 ATP synthase F1 subunit gamma [Candidatus Peregrinibacteria bacterium]